MHDFIQTLSFRSVESSSDREIAAASRLTTAATSEVLHSLTQSLNEVPAYRPSPRPAARRKLPGRTNRKS